MFTRAIVRKPCANIIKGITTADLGIPNYEKALRQHSKYVAALEECGLEVINLPADEDYPDSTFVEDTALLTDKCAIVSNPGALSRKGEISSVKDLLRNYYDKIEEIKDPGTLEPGDVMMVGKHFYIGLSERTNANGAEQLINILNKYGMTGSTIELNEMLHLKTGMAYLEKNNLLISGEFIERDEFEKFNKIIVDPDEAYSANCIWVNDKVIIPKGYPKSKKRIEKAGYRTIELEMSEFEKVDGGLSCLSFRF